MYIKDYASFRKSLAFFMLSPCRALYLFLLCLIATFAIFVLISFFAPIDEVVSAKALLRPYGVVSSVKVASSGEVESVNFFDGMSVEKGDKLFSLNVNSYKKELSSALAEKEQLEQSLISYKALYDVITTGEIEKKGKAYLEKNLEKNLAAAYSYYYEKKMKDLETEKAFYELESERRMPESMRVPYRIEQLRLAYETQKVEVMSWKQGEYASCIQNINSVEKSIATTENRIAELEKAIGESSFNAQIAGKVIVIHKLNSGDNVFSGEEILRIVPKGEDKLRAELYVSAADIAKIKNGNAVHISFPSLPPSIYGFLESNIDVIPPDCINTNSADKFFEVQTNSFSSELSERKKAHLISGIEGNAKIVTGHTTALRLFLKKLDFVQ